LHFAKEFKTYVIKNIQQRKAFPLIIPTGKGEIFLKGEKKKMKRKRKMVS
jgi:hypothetical protein